MAIKSERFAYTMIGDSQRGGVYVPFLPLCLFGITQPLEVSALVDSGATMNVLPQSIGLQLGLNWRNAISMGPLSGVFGDTEARAVKLRCQFGTFEPISLLFAWAETDSVRLILGQVDFFRQFRICFFESERAFEITAKV